MNTPIVITILRWAATLFFVVAGAMHFVIPDFYRAMMPPFLPFQDLLVIISGMAEMAGGIGLQVPRFRKQAGQGLLALLVAVFPANIYVAIAQPALPGIDYTPESMWWRLLLQPLFIAWVWWVAVRPRP